LYHAKRNVEAQKRGNVQQDLANTMQTSQNIMQHEKVFQMSQRPCKVRGSIPTDLLVFTAKPQA